MGSRTIISQFSLQSPTSSLHLPYTIVKAFLSQLNDILGAPSCTLWLWKTTIFNGQIQYKWQFSILMLIYERVRLPKVHFAAESSVLLHIPVFCLLPSVASNKPFWLVRCSKVWWLNVTWNLVRSVSTRSTAKLNMFCESSIGQASPFGGMSMYNEKKHFIRHQDKSDE